MKWSDSNSKYGAIKTEVNGVPVETFIRSVLLRAQKLETKDIPHRSTELMPKT